MQRSETLKIVQGLIKESPKTENWREQVEFRKANKDWLRKSAQIAIKILRVLRDKKMTQLQLAELLAVTPQQINEILKGRENLTLETIGKMEVVLGIELIKIEKFDEERI